MIVVQSLYLMPLAFKLFSTLIADPSKMSAQAGTRPPRKPPVELKLLILTPVRSISCPRVPIACDLQIFSSTFTDEAVAQLFSCRTPLAPENSQRITRANDDDILKICNLKISSYVSFRLYQCWISVSSEKSKF